MHVFPSNFLYVVFAIPLSSLYCNTLLANLNVRVYIRGEATTHYPGGDLVMMSLQLSGDTMAEQSRQTKLISSTHLVSVYDPSWLNRCGPG
jgi:hypothetical protein